MALYRCDWRWPDETARRTPDERDRAFASVFQAAETQAPATARLRGWYSYPGGVAGFLILDADTHEQLAQMLRPYTELMEFKVVPIVSVEFTRARQ